MLFKKKDELRVTQVFLSYHVSHCLPREILAPSFTNTCPPHQLVHVRGAPGHMDCGLIPSLHYFSPVVPQQSPQCLVIFVKYLHYPEQCVTKARFQLKLLFSLAVNTKRNETQYLLPRSNATKILHKIYLNNLHNSAPMSERLSSKTGSPPPVLGSRSSLCSLINDSCDRMKLNSSTSFITFILS